MTLIDNPKILLIHGWGGSKQSLVGLNQKLITDLNVETLYLELPGNGETPLTEVFDLDKYGDWVLAEWQKKFSEVDYPVFIGHSVGGKILLNLACRQKLPKEAVLIIIDASGLKPHLTKKQKLLRYVTAPGKVIQPALRVLKLENFYSKTFRRAFYKFIVKARDYEKVAADPIKKQTFLNLINTHLDEELLRKVQNPVLILWGEDDKATPLWMGQKLAQLLPNAQLKVFPGEKHNLPLVSPDKCSSAIKEYLGELVNS